MQARCLMLGLTVACGRLSFDPDRPPDGGGSGGELAIDASPCTWTAFGAPERAPVVNSTSDEYAPALGPGALTLYMHSYRSGGFGMGDIWMASRADIGQPFEMPSHLPELSSPQRDAAVTVATDGLEIFFESDRPGGAGGIDLWVATRADVNLPFSGVTPVANINTSADEATPALTPDGRELYFASDRAGEHDIYVSTRAARAMPFSPPVLVSEVSSVDYDHGPFLGFDGRELFVGSTRDGPGDVDIWVAERPQPTGPFGAPRRITELSSPRDDGSMELTPDGTTMFLSYDSDWAGGQDADLWIATRACQ